MSNLRDLNNGSNPVFDFINALTTQGQEHPLFAAYNPEARDRGERGPPPPEYGAPPPGDHEVPPGPPPPPSHEGPPPPPPPGHGPGPHHGPQHGPPPPHGDDPFDGHGFPFGGPPGGRGRHGGPHGGPHGGRHGSHSHGRRGGGWGGGWGGRGGGRCGGGRRGGGNPFEGGWGGPAAGGFDMSKLGEFISQFAPGAFPEASNDSKDASRAPAEGKDFQPPVDIFDTKDAYIVHVSLPGAKKEDVGANWDADKSELSIAGVIYRPGDEETLKTLALDERDVGMFERKVALGTKREPAQVDSDGISAKMEDGILIVNIPKLEQDFVEVKKVDIE